jgi:hypothetical protein
MRNIRRGSKAQALSEYGLFIAIVLIAGLAMNAYVKRGLQGRYADVTDHVTKLINSKRGSSQVLSSGAAPNYFVPNQYEPYYTDSTNRVSSPRSYIETVKNTAEIKKELFSTSSNMTSISTEGASWASLVSDLPGKSVGPVTATGTTVEIK